MKTDRRQELRTNELSQQIEQIGAYAKKNAAWLTMIVIVATAGVGGSYWYVHHRQQVRLEAWAALSKAAVANEPTSSALSTCESVIQKDLSPALTAAALLQMGDTAMKMYTTPGDPEADAAPATESVDFQDWFARAEEAYSQVVRRFPDDAPASGSAMIALGVLCEDRNEPAKAREWYQKVVGDARFAPTPLKEVAAMRLAWLDRWSTPADFPPPLHTVPMPPPAPVMPPDMGSLARTPAARKPAPGSPGPTPLPAGAPPTSPLTGD